MSVGTRMYAMMQWHLIVLVLVDDVQDGVFEDDGSRRILG
jgi:hypothetical protein